ncbi:MAG: G5 domain-containing protein [Patescibacteria group bacterium]|jgi:uncharacterized protein YabE (DUF348 family)
MNNKIIFALAGVAISASLYARVFAQSSTIEKGSLSHEYAKPYLVEVINPDGTKEREISGRSKSVVPFLIANELGSEPNEKDHFSAFPDIRLGIGAKITQHITPSYVVSDGRRKLLIRSWAGSVRDLLTEGNIDLGVEDKINFSLDTPLTLDMSIVIIRVARTTVVESEPIDFKTVKKDDPTIDKGQTRVEQKGQKGQKKRYFEVVREDGEEISKTLKRTEVTSEPISEIILVGTKPVITVRCKHNDTVIAASAKYNYDPNALCSLMMKESNGNPNSIASAGYKGLFQYEDGFWRDASKKAGYAGASVFDPTAQIYTTAWAFTHGYAGRW